METTDFLCRVLPAEGAYVALVLNEGKRPQQKFFPDITTLGQFCAASSAAGDNVYYAVASYGDTGAGRKVTNIHQLQALFLDVDCGADKPFADWRDGLRAVGQFVATHSLPKPLVVASGNGLHVYWVLTAPLSYDQWRPLANGLKALVPTDDLGRPLFDPAVPADGARVLRPVGTTNPKGGQQVRILIDASPVDVSALGMLVAAPAKPAKPVVAAATPKASSILDAMAARAEFPPAKPTLVASRCAQVGWAVANQPQVREPLWYALMGVAAHCEDPEQTAMAWSQNHPGYSAQETIAKLGHWRASTTGPATCARFDAERPGGCDGCRYAGKISTPARLGVEYTARPISADAPDADAARVAVPRPFKRTDTGIKVTLDDIDIDICPFDIYPLGYGYDEVLGYETVRFRWKRPHMGWQTLAFRQAYLTDQGLREFATSVADQGIVLVSKKQTEQFQMFLRSYMAELRSIQAMTNLYATMGWKENNTEFLLGDTLFRRAEDGTVSAGPAAFAASTARISEPMFASRGALQEWTAFTSVLERANMPAHMFALCVSMSAPLYQFTGLKGLTINLYGPTGSGKTLAQHWQQTVWGDPAKLHYTAKFTQNALFSRMGLYNNLPVTIDEATMLNPKEVGDFLYWVSQGRDKARLARNAEEKDAKTWATVVTTSSNRSMSSMLVAAGMETDAQMARLLEVTMLPHPLFTRSTVAGQQMYQFLSMNHGLAGPRLVSHYLAMGDAGLRAALEQHRKKFFARYSAAFSGSERFWEQCILLADFAGSVAAELGLIQFNHERGIEHVLTQLGALRATVAENEVDSFDIIAEYVNKFADHAVTVMHTGAQKPQPDFNRLPRGAVHIRFDVHRNTPASQFDRGSVLIDRVHFRRWLSTRGGDYRTIMRDIVAQGVDVTPPHSKAFLGKDTPIKLGQQYVIGVSLAHPRLRGILTDVDDAAASSQTASLVVLPGGRTATP